MIWTAGPTLTVNVPPTDGVNVSDVTEFNERPPKPWSDARSCAVATVGPAIIAPAMARDGTNRTRCRMGALLSGNTSYLGKSGATLKQTVFPVCRPEEGFALRRVSLSSRVTNHPVSTFRE
jgi:hypothetical protein